MNLPTTKKKIRVMIDWTIDLLFGRDITMIQRPKHDFQSNITAKDIASSRDEIGQGHISMDRHATEGA
jgi:hypothetical protein